MSQNLNKEAYFQGTEEPAPKKKKYKSDTKIVDQVRFKEPFYRNYDTYDVPGVSDKPKHGPGAGWHEMGKYKSIKEFLAARRKKMKDKYKADDSYIQDDGSITKKRADRRISLMQAFIKNGIDFPIDDQVTPILNEEAGTYSGSVPIGGKLDLTQPDFEGKSPDKLNYGRDYVDNETVDKAINEDLLKTIIEKYTKEPDLYGLPDGISPEEDLDADKTVNNSNTQYGATDSGNTLYENMWI